MPWPDFSELSFGYAFLSEFERQYLYGGRYPVAPTFISQQEEAHRGHDVEIALSDGTPVFIQLKRSFVVETANSSEGSSGWYRMYLRKKRSYDQHQKLRYHQNSGRNVLYITSRVKDRDTLWRRYANQRLVAQGSKAFAPMDIPMPTDSDQHWVSFPQSGRPVLMFSKEPRTIEDSAENVDAYLQRLRLQSNRLSDNLGILQEFTQDVLKEDPWVEGLIGSRVDSAFQTEASETVRRASIAAKIALDADLMVLPRLPLKSPGGPVLDGQRGDEAVLEE